MSEHRYTDDEVHAIFERAAKRQEEAERAEAASRAGLTLSELQEIGAASGIDPAHVAAAAIEARKPSGAGKTGTKKAESETVLGMPTKVRAERFLPHTIDDRAWEQIVPELRRLFNNDGVGSEIGRVREWSSRPSQGSHDRPPKLTLTPDGDGTRITIEQTLKSSAWGFMAGGGTNLAMGLMFFILSFFGTLPLVPGFVLTTVGVLFILFSWIGMRIYAKGQAEKFEAALDRIDLIVRDTAQDLSAQDGTPQVGRTQSEARVTPEAAPRISLDALPDRQGTERSSHSSDRTRS